MPKLRLRWLSDDFVGPAGGSSTRMAPLSATRQIGRDLNPDIRGSDYQNNGALHGSRISDKCKGWEIIVDFQCTMLRLAVAPRLASRSRRKSSSRLLGKADQSSENRGKDVRLPADVLEHQWASGGFVSRRMFVLATTVLWKVAVNIQSVNISRRSSLVRIRMFVVPSSGFTMIFASPFPRALGRGLSILAPVIVANPCDGSLWRIYQHSEHTCTVGSFVEVDAPVLC